MKEEKTGTGKIFIIFDWIWRLMVLNVLTIIFSIGIITLYPSLCACFKSIKDSKEEYTGAIIKPFIKNFVYFFKDTALFSIITILIIGIAGYGFLWYDGVIGVTAGSGAAMDTRWYLISLLSIIVIIVAGIMLLMVAIQIPPVMTYFYYGFKDSVRLAFFIAFKYVVTTIIELVVILTSIYILIQAIFGYYLIPIWLFFGISVPTYLIYILSRRYYKFISDNDDDDIDDTDYQNKKVNKEVYENDTITKKEGE